MFIFTKFHELLPRLKCRYLCNDVGLVVAVVVIVGVISIVVKVDEVVFCSSYQDYIHELWYVNFQCPNIS